MKCFGDDSVRLSLVEALCLVAIGATMVELHDARRFARPEARDTAALAAAAKPAVATRAARSIENANSQNAGDR